MGVALVGGTITGAGTLAGNTNLYGYGTVDINIATVGTIVAIAGRLEPDREIGPQGTVSGRSLMIGAPSAPNPSLNPTLPATLQIDGTAPTAVINGLSRGQEILLKSIAYDPNDQPLWSTNPAGGGTLKIYSR